MTRNQCFSSLMLKTSKIMVNFDIMGGGYWYARFFLNATYAPGHMVKWMIRAPTRRPYWCTSVYANQYPDNRFQQNVTHQKSATALAGVAYPRLFRIVLWRVLSFLEVALNRRDTAENVFDWANLGSRKVARSGIRTVSQGTGFSRPIFECGAVTVGMCSKEIPQWKVSRKCCGSLFRAPGSGQLKRQGPVAWPALLGRLNQS
jgi:hypothetical protein